MVKSCKRCSKRDLCEKVCAEVEARLPKDFTGRDTRRELAVDAAALDLAAQKLSYGLWQSGNLQSRRPVVDLSRLSPKEKNALMLIAQGMSMRAAARRLRINLNALQCRVASARRKLLAGQCADVAEGGAPSPHARKRGAR